MTKSHRIAVITMGVKLGNETKGYTRFLTVAQQLSAAGFEVDLITSSFQHWEKAQRVLDDPAYQNYPFRILFIEEPGYQKNVDLSRIKSHARATQNLKRLLEIDRASEQPYELLYAEIPPNDVARAAAEHARQAGIPFVVDVNDLWPEAMRMVLDIPVISSLLFAPLSRDARAVYQLISASVGTSDEYAARPFTDCPADTERVTVYVGGDKESYDTSVAKYASTIQKPAGEFWVTYAGTLGKSYDLKTLIAAAAGLKNKGFTALKVLIIGDGPDRVALEQQAQNLSAPVEFLGYRAHAEMAAWLVASDVLVNSLVRKAPQSIVNKIADYLFAGRPMINTGSSTELRNLVLEKRIGFNVVPEDTPLLAEAIKRLANDNEMRAAMGAHARRLAEERFDRARSYQAIVDLIKRLVLKNN